VEVHHYHYSNSDTREWPTPLAAFLRSGPWIPADEPASEGPRRIHVTPSEIWLAPEGGDRFPPFLRRPALPVMRALERASGEEITVLRRRARLRILNDPETLPEPAEFLAGQYAGSGFDRYFERHFVNLYHRTWLGLVERYGTPGTDLKSVRAPTRLVVRRGGKTAVDTMPASDHPVAEPVYVRDCDDETAASLIESSGRPFFDLRAANPARTGELLRNLYGPNVRLLSEIDYTVRADGQAIGAGDVAPVLERCPWLKALTAVAMEALKGTELPSDRSAVIDRLERVVLQRAGSIVFQIDGTDIEHSLGRRHAFALKLADGQPIVVTRTDGPISWDTIDASLGPVCEAIDQPALEPHLRLMVFALTHDAVLVDEAPPADLGIDSLCAVLRLDQTAARAVLETLGARLERHLPWLRAIVHMAAGSDGVDAFALVEAEAVQDVGRLRAGLAPALGALGLDPDDVLEACKCSLTVAELRDALGLSFETLNRSLHAVGEKPDTYPDLHASLVANYVHEHEVAIIDALRAAHAAALGRHEPAPKYAKQREASRHLVPNADWLLAFRDVPDTCIAAHVDAWLSQCGAPALGSKSQNLQPLDEVRRENLAAVRLFVQTAEPLLKAWCAKNGVPLPEVWSEANAPAGALRSALDTAGAYDFAALGTTSLLLWPMALGVWPTGMPQTLDQGVLGIAEVDLDTEKKRAREEAEARKREARSVPFNGRAVDPESVDWDALATELASGLSKKMLTTPIGWHTSLRPAKKGVSGHGTPRTPNRQAFRTGYPPRAPSQKTDMIGRLGELAIYNWLRERLPKQNIDAAWVSKNAQPFTGREGSDSLGYDFEISYRNQLWQIEVKASLGDPCAFEMGETEVRAARTTVRTRGGRQYRIAYVSNVGEPARTRVEMLPNPMSEEGEAVLNLLGEGLRYGFYRTS
jgi:Domain of unknown function (DUF3883)